MKRLADWLERPWAKVVGAILVVVALAYAVGDKWEETKSIAEDIGAWLYPLPLLIVAVGAIVGLALSQRHASRRDPPIDPHHVDPDRAELKAIQAELPRNRVEWAREHPFASAFHRDLSRTFHFYADSGHLAEKAFLDDVLEEKRQVLYQAVKAFSEALAQHTSPAQGGDEMMNIGSEHWEVQHGPEFDRRLEERVSPMEDAGAKVADAYDDLIATGRRRLGV